MHQSLDHIVPGAADRNKVFPRAVYGLVVGGVYRSAVSIELIKEIQTVYITMIDAVHLIFTDPFVPVCGVDVLRDVAAEIHIDELKALADTEHGLFFRRKKGERLKLQNIQFRVDVEGAVIALPEKSGCDIAAARQEQMGGVLGSFGIQSGVMGDAQSAQNVFVVCGIRCAAKNGDGGESRHVGFLSRRAERYYFILCGFGGRATIRNSWSYFIRNKYAKKWLLYRGKSHIILDKFKIF